MPATGISDFGPTAFVFLNMMVGTILDVMTQEFHRDSEDQAHRERDDMAKRLEVMERQIGEIREHLIGNAGGSCRRD